MSKRKRITRLEERVADLEREVARLGALIPVVTITTTPMTFGPYWSVIPPFGEPLYAPFVQHPGMPAPVVMYG